MPTPSGAQVDITVSPGMTAGEKIRVLAPPEAEEPVTEDEQGPEGGDVDIGEGP